MLWTNMILNGCMLSNIDDFLVYARTGFSMIERRGGWSYFKKYRKAKKKILHVGFISFGDYFVSIFVQFFVAVMPKKMRLWFYLKKLRR